jgi:solute carrier family 25, member 39/40
MGSDDITTISNKASISTRIISGTIGAIVTSLVVTPLEVVKVRTQAAIPTTTPPIATTPTPTTTTNVVTTNPILNKKRLMASCPKGCGTFVLYNGHMDCIVAKSSVPYFDPVTGRLFMADDRPVRRRDCSAVVTRTQTTQESSIGTVAMLRRIYAREGMNGIYAGLRPTLLMAAPNTILYYAAYEEIVWRMRQYVQQRHCTGTERNNDSSFLQKNESWLLPFVAGGSARLVSSTITAPLEYVRTRQAAGMGNAGRRDRSHTGVVSAQERTGGGLYHEFRSIVRNEGGIGTLYRGLRPTLWRDVPFSAIYWLLLEQFRLCWDNIRATTPGSKMSALEQAGEAFMNGAAAGLIAAACTTPFDVAKTRQQTLLLSASVGTLDAAPISAATVAAAQLEKHGGTCVAMMHGNVAPSLTTSSGSGTGTFHQLRLIAQTEGLAGLWRGNQARMLKVAPSCAIMLSSYELGKRILE